MQNKIDNIFFQLIRVSLGLEPCLPVSPTDSQWMDLYEIAKKQSLIGVCFAGVQRLQKQYQSPPEILYLQWMGMAAKIQQRNQRMNKHCAELISRLEKEGFKACILKGQGVGYMLTTLQTFDNPEILMFWLVVVLKRYFITLNAYLMKQILVI